MTAPTHFGLHDVHPPLERKHHEPAVGIEDLGDDEHTAHGRADRVTCLSQTVPILAREARATAMCACHAPVLPPC